MTSVDCGTRIDFNAKQAQNAASPRMESRDPRSNATIERFMQEAKHDCRISVTEEGIQMDFSEHLWNAHSPSTDTLEPLSNARTARFRHEAKHDLEMVSIDEGMQMDWRSTAVAV
jgi:hypothetical protein